MPVAYFIRGGGESWALIALHPDDREEVEQDGLTFMAAEDLCLMKQEEIARAAPEQSELPLDRDIAPRRRPRQLKFRF